MTCECICSNISVPGILLLAFYCSNFTARILVLSETSDSWFGPVSWNLGFELNFEQCYGEMAILIHPFSGRSFSGLKEGIFLDLTISVHVFFLSLHLPPYSVIPYLCHYLSPSHSFSRLLSISLYLSPSLILPH